MQVICFSNYKRSPNTYEPFRVNTAGFINRSGKGSHRNFVHPDLLNPITISGKLGDDAKHYQEKEVKKAIKEADEKFRSLLKNR